VGTAWCATGEYLEVAPSLTRDGACAVCPDGTEQPASVNAAGLESCAVVTKEPDPSRKGSWACIGAWCKGASATAKAKGITVAASVVIVLGVIVFVFASVYCGRKEKTAEEIRALVRGVGRASVRVRQTAGSIRRRASQRRSSSSSGPRERGR
jgi:hypothetical protein